MSDGAPSVRPTAATPTATNGSARPVPTVAATPPVPVVVEEPPPPVQQLPRGTVVQATAGAPLPDGRTVLQLTAPQRLTLPVLLPDPPPPGTQLRLRVLVPGIPTRLALLPALPHPQAPAEAPSQARSQAPPQTLRAAGPGATAGGVPQPTVSAPVPRLLAVGDVVRGIVRPTAPRLPIPVLPSLTPRSGIPNPGAAASPQPGPATFRILAIQPPTAKAAPQASAPAPAADKTLTGTVQTSAAGTTTVRTPSATITLDQAVRAPVGSRVVLHLGPAGRPPPATVAPLAALGTALPSLPNALDVLSTTAPVEAAHIRDNVVPATGPRLTTGLVFLLAALNRADFAGWLGQSAARALNQLPPETMAPRLGEEFAQLVRSSSEPMPGEWRAMALPLFHGEEFDHLKLFIQGDADNDADDAHDTRFVIEADLSQLGPIQLDGVVRDTTKFDLTLRTTRALADAQQTELSNLFTAAGAAANFAGTLKFEVLPVLPTPAIDDAPATTMGVFA